jgi:hypothetical protein
MTKQIFEYITAYNKSRNMLTIEKIEGNSRVGVPVFSLAGKKSNYKILLFQPTFEEKRDIIMRNK